MTQPANRKTIKPAAQVTCLFLDIGDAEALGIRSILHTDYKSTCAKLAALGLHNA
jgi:hypothetical protein